MLTKRSGVIVGAVSLEKNDYDGHTLEGALRQYKEFYNREPNKAIVDLGYKGIKKIGTTEIVSPQKKGKTLAEKRRLRKDHRRRSSIEANISHLKNNPRLDRNYYRYVIGDTINLLLSASGYNFKRMMRKWAEKMKYFLSFLISSLTQIFYPKSQLKT
jgi:IS5 family transposase